jgi:FKBP-type peptidyl-prolyl cis-trans isomerase SlyD
MVISKNKVVSLSYELRRNAEDGEMVEVVNQDTPLTFMYGVGQMLEKFEANLMGYTEGQAFNFRLNSEEAYGETSDEAIIDLPKAYFLVDGKLDTKMLQIGSYIPMKDDEGNLFNGKVVDITEDMVTLDFNHPLAGDTLFFVGQVVNIREATAEELHTRHIHKEGCNHCHSH